MILSMRIPATMLLFWILPLSAGDLRDLPKAVDLRSDGAIVEQRELPLLVMVSRDHCSFCERLKRQILVPMLRSGQYEDRVLIRELTIDPGNEVRDFGGETVATAELAGRYGIFLTPTLLFLDSRGGELTQRMLGINTPEMYGWYLDRSLEEARAQLMRSRAGAHGDLLLRRITDGLGTPTEAP